METLAKIVGTVVLIIAVVAAFAVILALPTMLLWNWLMPEIFGLPTIGFFQALGLLLLSGFLLKSSSSSSKD